MQKLFFLLLPFVFYAQVGINTTTPLAALDVNSSTNGILIPRLTNHQRDSIINPEPSVLIFNLELNKYQYFFDNKWITIDTEINYSFEESFTGKYWFGKKIMQRVFPINFLVGNNLTTTISFPGFIDFIFSMCIFNEDVNSQLQGKIDLNVNFSTIPSFFKQISNALTLRTIQLNSDFSNHNLVFTYSNSYYMPLNNVYYIIVEYVNQ